MIEPRIIDADGKQVVVKLMDDSWTFNQCVSARPFRPKHGDGKFPDEYLHEVMADNPRNSDAEQREKEEIMRKLRTGAIDPEPYAFQYDLGRSLR